MKEPVTKPADHWAEFEAVQREGEAVLRGEFEPAQTAPPPGQGGWLGHGDPIERAANYFARQLPEGTPNWLRTAGRFIIPQNAPELAVTVATLPLGGVGGMAAKTAAKGVLPVITRALKAGAKGAAAAGLTGGATGHDPYTSGALGALGVAGGQLGGEALAGVLQTKTVQRMTQTATDKLAEVFSGIFKNIPAAGSAKDAFTRVITGETVDRLEKEIRDLGAMYTANPRGWPGMADSEIAKWTALTLQNAGDQAGKVLDRNQIPRLSALWKYGTNEVREGLIKQGYIFANDATKQGAFNVLNKETKDANLIWRWMTGVHNPALKTKEELLEIGRRLVAEDGRLSAEGVMELAHRWQGYRSQLESQLGKPRAQELAGAVWHEIGQGLQRGGSGQAPKVSMSVIPNARTGVPIPKIEAGGARLPTLPGWEKQAGRTLGEGALKVGALAGPSIVSQAPLKPFERPAPPEPPPPPALGTPPPADAPDRGRESERSWFVEPPPTRPSPPSWFRPSESAPEESSDVNLEVIKH